MHPTFNIQSSENAGVPLRLMIQIGKQGVSFVATTTDGKTSMLTSYHFSDEINSDGFIAELTSMIDHSTLHHSNFTQVDIIYAFPEAVIVPKEYYNEAVKKEMLELFFDFSGDESMVQTDFQDQQNLYTVYTFTKKLHHFLQDRYPNAKTAHQYSLMPGIIQYGGKHLYCIFDKGTVTVQLQVDEKLVVIQHYFYNKPEDVSYYLLGICQHFNVSPDEITVHLNGMIDEHSNLYKELYKYFLQLQFEPLPDHYSYGEGITEYPSHYFSHLFSFAQCV